MTEPSQYFKGRTVQEQMNEVIGYVDTRAAEVATTAIASDVAQVHQDMLDADADAAAAAASAAAAAGTLANAVKKTGEASQSIAGDIAVSGTLSGGTVTGTTITAPTPVNNTDAANKKYVDDADALKLNITDVNTVAVGLTGAQDVFGLKKFQIRPYVKPNTSKALTVIPTENQYVKLYDIATGGIPRTVHGFIKSLWFIQNRFEIEFWVGGFNSSSTFSFTRSLGLDNSNLRVTRDANNVWSIWFRYEAGTNINNRAFSEIIDQFYSYNYNTDLITVIDPADQVILNESAAEWLNYTIIANQEIA